MLHLVEMVRDLGPLWANTCYEFENANGTINKLFHGTKKIDMQVITYIYMYMYIYIVYFAIKIHACTSPVRYVHFCCLILCS